MDNSNASDYKRLFIAVRPHLSDKFAQAISFLRKSLPSNNINWVPLENIHVTIKYLGNSQNLLIKSIEQAIVESTTHSQPFKLIVKNIGTFGKSHPKVLWAGIEPSQSLLKLHNKVEENATKIGYAKENRPYFPHITLARLKGPIEHYTISNMTTFYSNTIFQESKIDEVILYESISRKGTPIYRPLWKTNLNPFTL